MLDEGQAGDPELIAAMLLFHSAKRSAGELLLRRETAQSINQNMLTGLLRYVLKSPP